MGFSYLTVYRNKLTVTFTQDYKTLRINTGFKCSSRDFSKKNQMILPSSKIKDQDYINTEIKAQKKKIDDLIKYSIEKYGEIEIDKLKELIKNPSQLIEENKSDDLISLLQDFIDVKKYGRTNKAHNLKSHLIRFNGDKKIRPMEVDLRFLNEFEDFLYETNGANSTKKYFNVLKGFYKYLIRYKSYPVNAAIRDKKISGEEPFFVVLTDEQIGDLRNYVPQSSSQDRIKDIFLILILTGMSWTDYENCSIDFDQNIIQGDRKKTKTPFKVALHQDVVSILNKRQNQKPIVSAPVFNRLLKRLLANIPSFCFKKTKRGKEILFCNLVSSHTGRHTFIDRGLRNDIPIQALMTFVGHKSPKQLLDYAKKHLITQNDFELINRL